MRSHVEPKPRRRHNLWLLAGQLIIAAILMLTAIGGGWPLPPPVAETTVVEGPVTETICSRTCSIRVNGREYASPHGKRLRKLLSGVESETPVRLQVYPTFFGYYRIATIDIAGHSSTSYVWIWWVYSAFGLLGLVMALSLPWTVPWRGYHLVVATPLSRLELAIDRSGRLGGGMLLALCIGLLSAGQQLVLDGSSEPYISYPVPITPIVTGGVITVVGLCCAVLAAPNLVYGSPVPRLWPSKKARVSIPFGLMMGLLWAFLCILGIRLPFPGS